MVFFACLFVGFIFMLAILKIRQFNSKLELLSEPFPDHWLEIIKERVPLVTHLPAELEKRLLNYCKLFLNQVRFEGCHGFQITDEVKLVVSAQAGLLILNKGIHAYKKLHTVLIYPNAFESEQTVEVGKGVFKKQHQLRSGESWVSGTVILSWQSVLNGGIIDDDGKNVVFHEFAHQLDQSDGVGDGVPVLNKPQCYSVWSRIFQKEFTQLQKKLLKTNKSLIDSYGATHPAEFFAVVSEIFFEQPKKLSALHPELYNELSLFYSLDPKVWTK